MDAIFKRVSVRNFQDKAVEQEKVDKILHAAMQSPSAGNQQPWEFYVVTNKEKIAELSKVSDFQDVRQTLRLYLFRAKRKQTQNFLNLLKLTMRLQQKTFYLKQLSKDLAQFGLQSLRLKIELKKHGKFFLCQKI